MTPTDTPAVQGATPVTRELIGKALEKSHAHYRCEHPEFSAAFADAWKLIDAYVAQETATSNAALAEARAEADALYRQFEHTFKASAPCPDDPHGEICAQCHRNIRSKLHIRSPQ